MEAPPHLHDPNELRSSGALARGSRLARRQQLPARDLDGPTVHDTSIMTKGLLLDLTGVLAMAGLLHMAGPALPTYRRRAGFAARGRPAMRGSRLRQASGPAV
jgi:hypothetical protein